MSGTGTLTRRGDYWYMDWTDEKGERHRSSTRTTDKSAALQHILCTEMALAGENRPWGKDCSTVSTVPASYMNIKGLEYRIFEASHPVSH